MKGQYLTLEYLIFFAIGIIIIISVYFLFSDINETYRKSILQNQLKMTGELISGAIINVYEVSTNTNSRINYTLPIPTKLSNCIYTVNISDNKLFLNCINVQNMGINLTLYNFNIESQNIIYSTSGVIKLYASNGKVELS